VKVGILTFQFADNYGAVLQCLALQESCKKYAGEVFIINYLPRRMISKYIWIKKKLIPKRVEKKFEEFRKCYFKRSSVNDKYDVIIVGSDQVWNFDITGYDDFWINPKIDCKRLCSYAASFGKSKLSENEKKYINNHKTVFERYDVLSVRENAGVHFLNSIGVNAETVCDPTMLLYYNLDMYNNMAKKTQVCPAEKYLFVYSLEYSVELDQIIKKVKEETKLKVYSIHPMNDSLQICDEFVENASVDDFLSLIKNAEYVLTNSFHGLAFSYIFRKKVYCVHHSSLSSRQAELITRSNFTYESCAENVYYIDTNQETNEMKFFVEQSENTLKRMVTLLKDTEYE